MTEKKKISIEKAMEKLEKVVDELEQGNIDLEEAFDKFENAVKMSKYIKKQLDEYERKIEVIKQDLTSDKGYKLEEFDEENDNINIDNSQ